MGRSFYPAGFPGNAPPIQSMQYDSAQTFKIGALVVRAADGEIVEFGGGTDAVVLGVALQGANTNPGYDAANSPTVVTGRAQEVSVSIASRGVIYSARLTSVAGGDPTTPTLTMIGEQYGVVKVGDDWVVDLDEVTTKIVEIIDVDILHKIVFVKFLEAVITPA